MTKQLNLPNRLNILSIINASFHRTQKFGTIKTLYLNRLKKSGSVAKNLAILQNQKKPSQLGKLIIFIRKKMIHKGENYSVKMQKYYFCNGTIYVSLISI